MLAFLYNTYAVLYPCIQYKLFRTGRILAMVPSLYIHTSMHADLHLELEETFVSELLAVRKHIL